MAFGKECELSHVKLRGVPRETQGNRQWAEKVEYSRGGAVVRRYYSAE